MLRSCSVCRIATAPHTMTDQAMPPEMSMISCAPGTLPPATIFAASTASCTISPRMIAIHTAAKSER